jgi:exosortase/archaeosortase family protein
MVTRRKERIAEVNWKFLGLFTLYLGIIVGLAQIPREHYGAISRFTAWAVAAFWSILLFQVSSSGTHVTFHGFTMEIILECTGLHYAAIFAAAVLAFQGGTVSNKAKGLLAGIGLIFVINLLRLGMLGVIGHYSIDIFSFMHLSLWHALFTFMVLFFWIVWVNGKFDISWLRARRVLLVIAATSLSFWFMYAYLDAYLSFLASAADIVVRPLNNILSLPSSVTSRGALIGYVSGEYVIFSETGLYTLNIAVFLALAAVNARLSDHWRFIAKFMAGAGFMILFHLCLVLMDWSLEVTAGETLSSVLTWCMVLSSMVAPLVSWFGSDLLLSRRQECIEN